MSWVSRRFYAILLSRQKATKWPDFGFGSRGCQSNVCYCDSFLLAPQLMSIMEETKKACQLPVIYMANKKSTSHVPLRGHLRLLLLEVVQAKMGSLCTFEWGYWWPNWAARTGDPWIRIRMTYIYFLNAIQGPPPGRPFCRPHSVVKGSLLST